jgi:hypothetical protein
MMRTGKKLLIGALSGLLLALPACVGSEQPATSAGHPTAMSDEDMSLMLDQHQKEMQKMMQQQRDEMEMMMHGHDEMGKTMQSQTMMRQHNAEMEKMKQSHDEMEKMLQRHREALRKAIPSRGIPSKPGAPQHSY